MDLLKTQTQLPILAWIGPCGNQINDKSMSDLAEGGWNLSLSVVGYTEDCFDGSWQKEHPIDMALVKRHLDCAKAHGIRLVVALPGVAVAPGELSNKWREKTKELIDNVRDHEGLFGYYICDEPKIDRFEAMRDAFAFIRQHDPEHLCYLNHWAVGQTWAGLRSYEDMWDQYIEMCQPDFVSADLYPIKPLTEEEWLREKDNNALYYPRHKAKISEHFFEMHEVLRQYSRIHRIANWNFTQSTPTYSPATAEGEMSFQLMTALAYGCTGLQYFSYAIGNHMINGKTLEPNENWKIAKKLNHVVRSWEPYILRWRSIGVYHYPHNVPYTRPLDNFLLGSQTDLMARGDAVVVGHFADKEGWEYALIVNRSPFEPALSLFHFGTDDGVEECRPASGAWGKPWPYNPREQQVYLQPGQGRLFRFKRDIRISDVYGI